VNNHGKNHCLFCYHQQTTYGCNLCKVLLCKTARKGSSDAGSCYEIWHTVVDLMVLHYKNKRKLSEQEQLHEWFTHALLPNKTITRIKGQTFVKLFPKKLPVLGMLSLIQREVRISLPDRRTWFSTLYVEDEYVTNSLVRYMLEGARGWIRMFWCGLLW